MASFEMFSCFRDSMVLQRDRVVNIWGFAAPGTELILHFRDNTYSAMTGIDGEFVFKVESGNAGGPFEMTIETETDAKIIKDILVGDVYLISGQSNMELRNERAADYYGPAVDDIFYPQIREYRVTEQISFGKTLKQYDDSEWLIADNKTDFLNMSATGFCFAKYIHTEKNIPIGLINTAIGGTPIEAHLPEEVLRKYKIYDEVIEFCKDEAYVEGVKQADLKDMEEWYGKLDLYDIGLVDGKPVFAESDFDDSLWKEFNIPGTFFDHELEHYHGSVWFRKEIIIPENYNLDGVMLRFGTMIDADKIYVNGTLVGSTDYCYPPRNYMIEQGVLKHGRNVITVRMILNRNTGAFTSNKRYCLQGKEYIHEGSYMGTAENPADANPVSGRWEMNIAGTWKYCKGAFMDELPLMTFFSYKPTALYNGMTYPLLKYAFAGSLWYQGESNVVTYQNYCELTKELVAMYRKNFGEKFPFLYVQLPQYNDPGTREVGDDWAYLREQQRRATKIENVAMAVAIDAGESNDLHPLNKDEIGKRLALGARKLIYNDDVEYISPTYEKAAVDSEKSCIDITFSHYGNELKLVNDNADYFEISDGQAWYKAKKISVSENVVSVYYEENIQPDKIRYAWSNDPCNPPVYADNGLPASPFIEEL